MKKKFLSGLISLSMAFSAVMGSIAGAGSEVSAAQANWKFDLGGSGAAAGFTGVSAADGYNVSRGYGFSGSVSNVGAAGSGEKADAVKFTGGTFNVDLPKGLYQVTVTTGNSPRTTINIEGMPQMINLTGNNAVESIQIPVTDGQLNIAAVAGMNKADYTISSIEITQLNNTGQMKPTIWICGDSTVANYYNTPDTAQHGWGQYLKNYINSSVFEVRNQASSGQYAKGFYDGGQFDAIKTYGKSGDYYIISIGINDTNYSNATEYYNVVTEMVKTAKSKGMSVILVKQQGRHGDLNRNPKLTGRWFGGELDKIAAEQQVQVVDLFNAWQDFGFSIGGYDAMTPYYAIQNNGSNDDLHQSAQGAQKNAELLQGLMKIGDPQLDPDAFYTLKNTNSGMMMEIKDGKTEQGANIQQYNANGLSNQVWKLSPFSGGTYHYVRSAADPNYVLKAISGENGGNIELVPYAGNDSMMLFQFTRIGDGSYYITTRSSRDTCFVEVDAASKNAGANIQQWSCTYNPCQNWQLIKTTEPSRPVTPPSAEPSTPPSAPPSSPPSEENTVMGDVNKDGTINISDLILIKSIASGENEYKTAADVSGDGKVDAEDVKIMQDYCFGKSVNFVKPENPSDPSEPVYYYAVDQVWDQGIVETTNSGYTNPAGYINLDNNDTSSITFTVNASAAGNYMTHIRFANGTPDDRPMKVVVNNNTDSYWIQSFTGTGAWTTWAEFGIVLPLVKGTNTIKLISTVAGKGGPNLDYINISPTDEPIAETYDPNAGNNPVTGDKPTLFILGDSTVQSYRESYAPQQGWGYYLGNYFTSDVTVANHSLAGRSSKKAYDEGRWKTIADSMKAGDYVMIQFAINDAGASNADRYAPTCGNADNPSAGSYEWYMTQFIKDSLAKGGTPVLVTTVIGMKAYSNGKFNNSYTNYCDACKQLAAKYKIPCIDLNSIMVNHYNSVGYNTALSYHLMGAVEGSTDGTHFCEKGADVVAGLVAGAVKDQKISGLSNYVR